MAYYAEKEQNKKEREQYLEKSNQLFKDEVDALHNEVKEYVTRLNQNEKKTNETSVS